MKTEQVLATYDAEYARSYDDRFHRNDRTRPPSDREIEIVRQFVSAGGRWLDVACGTGYVLSHFPGVARAGLDLSPAMLDLARQRNPDALLFREGDFRDPVTEWDGAWDVVTCMWYAYCLVDSMTDVERVVRNLANWTARGGVCFVPLCNPELLNGGAEIPYRRNDITHGGTLLITGVIWTWIEESGIRNDNMIAPQIEHMAAMFEECFSDVNVVEYPLYKEGEKPVRKAIVARSPKREVMRCTST